MLTVQYNAAFSRPGVIIHRIVNGTVSFYGSESRLIDDTKYGFLLLSTGGDVSPAAVTRSILTNPSEPAAVLSFHGKPHSNLFFHNILSRFHLSS